MGQRYRKWAWSVLLIVASCHAEKPKPSPPTCTPKAGADACLTCCRSNHTEGVNKATSLATACLCRPEVCADACADSYCSLGLAADPTPACAACMKAAYEEGQPCNEVEDTCENTNKDCAAMEDCVKDCIGAAANHHLNAGEKVTFTSSGISPVSPWNGKVVLQAFWWDFWNDNYPNAWWDYLAALAPRLRALGIDAIWIPPGVKNKGQNSVGYSPFDPYDLGDKWQRGSVGTRAGTKDQFLRMVAVMHANGIDVIEDIVLNHLDGAGSNTGAGGQDPAAWDDFTTGRYKNFRYVSYATPAKDESEADYFGRQGRWPKNWQNFHPNPGHNTHEGDWASPWFGPDVCYQSGAFGESSNAGTGKAFQTANYMRDASRVWLVWFKKQTGVDGFRFDAVKHFEPEVIDDLLYNTQFNAGWASGGGQMFAVSEFVGDAGQIDGWANSVQNRSGTFDFALRQGLKDMISAGGGYNLGDLPGKQQGNRTRTVPYVNSHDTLRPKRDPKNGGNYAGWDDGQELGGHIDPFDPRLLAAYAVAIAVDGAPMVNFEDLFDIGGTGKAWSHDPTDAKQLPVRDGVANLIWSSRMLAFKWAPYKVRWQAADLLVIERSGKALVGVNDHWTAWQDAWVQTDFSQGTKLHDYSGANTGDIWVQNDSKAHLYVPPCNGSNVRRCYAVWGPAGIAGQFAPPPRPTTQEWDLANDLGDSHANSLRQGGALPDKSTDWRLAGHVFGDAGKPLTAELFPTVATLPLEIAVFDGSKSVAGAKGKGALKATMTPAKAGWLTLKVRNDAKTNAGQRVFVKATYQAPAVLDPKANLPPAP